jgi:hypothetical protein
MALQRPRAARFARTGSPLNARPLGGALLEHILWPVLLVTTALGGAGCSTTQPSPLVFQNLVVWNSTDKPERLVVRIDDHDTYSGILGTIDESPKIVMTRQLAFGRGRHVVSAELPSRSEHRSVEFSVGDRPVNIHVAIRSDGLRIDVTYGLEAYL